MKSSKILNIVRIPLMTVIIILCAWIAIPFPIPFTMQTLGIYCALLLLGGKAGTLSIVLYILMGAAGLPVFSGFSAGIGHLLSPAGGYIWGFLLCAVALTLTEKFTHNKDFLKILTLSLGTLLCYTAGALWFTFSAQSLHSLWQVLTLCVLPFIIPDFLKIIFALLLCKKVRPLIDKTTRNDNI